LGFGPDIGLEEGGFKLRDAWINTKFSLRVGSSDFFGWPTLSWVMVPFGLWANLRNKQGWMISLVFPSLVLTYSLYWIGAWLYGPRYYFEGIFSITFLTASGIRWAAGKINGPFIFNLPRVFEKIRFITVSTLISILIIGNLLFYVPLRIGNLKGLYGHHYSRLEPFLSEKAQALTPSLVIVHMQKDWTEYGTLLELSSPYNDTPFIFTFSRGDELDQKVIQIFPERAVYHYYADQPNIFYTAPRPLDNP
jgi:hypothetical protein